MQSEFWHERWENQQIGFHLEEVNSILLKYWPAMEATPGQRVLVPLCGKTLDIIWLLKQGYAVVGIELSELALDELADTIRSELQFDIQKTREQHGVVYRGDNLLLIAGDFFAVTAEEIGSIDAVYDRAALVALPASMRSDYCQHLQAISPTAKQLLVSFSYDQNAMSGPPFAVWPSEVAQHYDAGYDVALQEQREIIQQEPRFKERGLQSFVQDVYLLTPR